MEKKGVNLLVQIGLVQDKRTGKITWRVIISRARRGYRLASDRGPDLEPKNRDAAYHRRSSVSFYFLDRWDRNNKSIHIIPKPMPFVSCLRFGFLISFFFFLFFLFSFEIGV